MGQFICTLHGHGAMTAPLSLVPLSVWWVTSVRELANQCRLVSSSVRQPWVHHAPSKVVLTHQSADVSKTCMTYTSMETSLATNCLLLLTPTFAPGTCLTIPGGRPPLEYTRWALGFAQSVAVSTLVRPQAEESHSFL